MAQEDAGRPLHSGGTDGRISSATPDCRSHHSKASPNRERRSTGNAKNGDGTEFPRYFLQLGNDIKRNRGYQMIQELQLMVCNKETGIRGNAARARVLVLLREVQHVLIGLENKIDSQTYDLGVSNVERSELRKELRDEKAKELQPLHTIDFRSTEVKDLPFKLRTLFEDNQVLREQVRSLQYVVRSTESKLDVSEKRVAGLEAENAALSQALREAGSTPDIALEMRMLREGLRMSETRNRELEMQFEGLQVALSNERRQASQSARNQAAKQVQLEARLTAALGVAPRRGSGSFSAGGGGSSGSARRKSSGRSGIVSDVALQVEDFGGSSTWAGRAGNDVTVGGWSIYGTLSSPYDAAGSGGGGAVSAGGGAAAAAGGYGAGVDGRSSAHSRAHSQGTASAGGGGVGAGGPTARSSAGRERSISPPRSPSGRSISHSPGCGIPTLYPLFNAKPRPTHAFSADSSANWLTNTSSGNMGGGAGGGVGSGNSPRGNASAMGGGSSTSSAQLPPPPPPPHFNLNLNMNLSRSNGQQPQPSQPQAAVSAGGTGAGGRPSSDSISGRQSPPEASASAHQETRRPSYSGSTGGGDVVRAINSSAVITSRPLLPSVSNMSGMGLARSSSSNAGGSGGGAGIGIRALRVSVGSSNGGTATGGGAGVSGGGSLRRSADNVIPTNAENGPPSYGVGGGSGSSGGLRVGSPDMARADTGNGQSPGAAAPAVAAQVGSVDTVEGAGGAGMPQHGVP